MEPLFPLSHAKNKASVRSFAYAKEWERNPAYLFSIMSLHNDTLLGQWKKFRHSVASNLYQDLWKKFEEDELKRIENERPVKHSM